MNRLDEARARVAGRGSGSAKSSRPFSGLQTNGHAEPSAATAEVETFTAAELAVMELPEPRFVVPGLIPDGLTLLAGKPKPGKSWIALNLALAVATGGVALGFIRVEAGDVLYLALEDTRQRLQSWLAQILRKTNARPPGTLSLATAWPRHDKGGIGAVMDWLESRKDSARLVIIDTWQKLRPSKLCGKNDYEQDYEHAGQLKALADKYALGRLALTHCRKADASDVLDSVSGTLGLTGAADATLVLKRQRGQADAELFATSRDLEERELAL
jgi:RecA-family ATPase